MTSSKRQGPLKMWIGNYDGQRRGLVIATSKVKARAAIGGRLGARHFDDFWSLQASVDPVLKPETLYTQPNDPGHQTNGWTEGRCELKPRKWPP